MNYRALPTINEIMLKTKQKWVINTINHNNTKAGFLKASILNIELANTGFLLSKELLDAFAEMPIESFNRAAKNILIEAQKLLGYKIGLSYVLFEDFPYISLTKIGEAIAYLSDSKNKNFVIFEFLEEAGYKDLDRVELLTNGNIVAVTKTKEKIPLENFEKAFKIIDLGTSKDISEIFESLAYSKSPLSKHQLTYLKTLFLKKSQINTTKIVQREIFATIYSIRAEKEYFSKRDYDFAKFVAESMSNPKDLLRIAAVFSQSDVSLKEVFFNLKTWHKFFITAVLNHFTEKQVEQTKQDYDLWIKLFQTIHISSNRFAKFDNAQSIAKQMRSNKHYAINKTENAIQEIIQGDFVKGVQELSKTPGYFLRNLDMCIRKITKEDISESSKVKNNFSRLIDTIAYTAEKVDLPLLLQVAKLLSNTTIKEKRAFFPGGGFQKMILEKDDRVVDVETYTQAKLFISNLLYLNIFKKISKKENPFQSAKKVFVKEELETIIAPISMKNIQEGYNQTTTGSLIKSDKETEIYRLFVWWKETKKSSRVDVDLSAIAFDENFKRLRELAYYNIDAEQDEAIVHSGDITSAPMDGPGSSEFIDINCSKLLEENPDIRYVGVSLNVFTQQNFNIFDCEAGFMERNFNGEIYEPSTVKNKFSIKNNIQNTIPFLFDVKEKKIMWVNVGLPSKTRTIRVDENTKKATIEDILMEIYSFHSTKLTIAEIIKIHAAVFNIEIVSEQEEADLIFENTPETITTFSSMWL